MSALTCALAGKDARAPGFMLSQSAIVILMKRVECEVMINGMVRITEASR